MSELDRLIEAVEAGDDGGVAAYHSSRVFPVGYAHVINAYHGSLDAAKALHEALLPGFDYRLSRDVEEYGALVFQSGRMDEYSGNWQFLHSSAGRAWLLAVLKAYRDSNQTEGAR